MNGEQIKEKIEALNDQIRELMFPTQFILNHQIADAMQQIRDLQNQCPHEFEDGICKYCYMKEEKD